MLRQQINASQLCGTKYVGCKIIASEYYHNSTDSGYAIGLSKHGLVVWWKWLIKDGKPFYHGGRITKQ